MSELHFMGHLWTKSASFANSKDKIGGIVEVEQEDAGEEAEEMGLMQTADSRRQAEEAGTSSRAEPKPTSRGVRGEAVPQKTWPSWRRAKRTKPGKLCDLPPNRSSCQLYASSYKKLWRITAEASATSTTIGPRDGGKTSRKHASFTGPPTVSWSATLWALQLPNLCGSQRGMGRTPRHIWTHKPLRPLALCLQMHLYTVCQKREQVLQRERGSEFDRKPRLLKLTTSTTERASPALHHFGGKFCRLCCFVQWFLILECDLSRDTGGEM